MRDKDVLGKKKRGGGIFKINEEISIIKYSR